VITIYQRYRRTDRRTDNTELRYASRGKTAKITVLIITQFQLHTISAESMGAIAPTAKKLWGDALKSLPQEFCYVIFETVKCTLKYEFIIMRLELTALPQTS